MKRNLTTFIALFILFGIYYWYNGVPFVNKWLFGTITGEISVKVNGEYIDHSEIEVFANELDNIEDKHEFYVKRKVKRNMLKYSMRMGVYGNLETCYYKLSFIIKDDSLVGNLNEEQLTCVLEVPAEAFGRNYSEIDIDIQETGDSYKAICNTVHEYWNGNKARECKEIELKNQRQRILFDFCE